MLVKQGKLAKEKLDDALQTQKATLQRLGPRPHRPTTTSPTRTCKDALQVQVSQIVFKVFRWRDGEYHFAPTDSVDFDRDNFTPMSADFILMEGIRMVDEWPIIEKKIPSMDIVFRPVVEPSMIEVAGGGPATADPAGDAAPRAPLREQDPAHAARGADLPQGGRHAAPCRCIIDSTGIGEFERLPDAVRPAEPQPHHHRGPRAWRATSTSGAAQALRRWRPGSLAGGSWSRWWPWSAPVVRRARRPSP